MNGVKEVKAIAVGKDAFKFLEKEWRLQKGTKLDADALERCAETAWKRCIKFENYKDLDLVRIADDWFPWNVDTIKKMLNERELEWIDADPVLVSTYF